jgi:ATP-dependent RNA helicase SUPV3L1/SUV3
MLDAEINPNGTVLVEGHHVGELQGFRFTADASAGGEDAKAVKTAAQKALAAEFEARAERFAASGNGDIALASDGTLRWIGAPIGTLVAGEDVLKPRVILLADEQLEGAARDKVQARAERFVNFQVESLLKPLADLKAAEQLTGIARGIAFRLVESLGLINRREIAEDIRSLDQEGRAALRRLGVRFGAYHIFIPALIKPAPAGLVTLLWALGNDGKDKLGFGDVVHALASGRTSMVVNQSFDKDFYRLAGYRNLGRRAVRVDILERLADLIRPATMWKPGTGPRPEGAYDGQAFIVTPPMMSILGATADDMEEILKGLGYRAEPKPAEEVKARLEAIDAAAQAAAEAKAQADAAKAPTAEGDAAPAGDDAVSQEAETASIGTEAAPSEIDAHETDVAGQHDADVSEPADHGKTEPVGEDGTETITATDSEAETPAPGPEAETAADHAPAAVDDTAAEAEAPKPILLWRQQRFDRPRGGQRHDHRGRGGPRHGRPGDAQGGDQQPGEKQGGWKRGRGRPQDGQGEQGERRHGRPQGERPDHRRDGRPDRKGKPDSRRHDRAAGGKDGGQGGKPAFQGKPREERPARFDPDSPFAKLAALRDQLKK